MKSDLAAGQIRRHIADGPVPLVVLVTHIAHDADGPLWVYFLDHSGMADVLFISSFTRFWRPLQEGQ